MNTTLGILAITNENNLPPMKEYDILEMDSLVAEAVVFNSVTELAQEMRKVNLALNAIKTLEALESVNDSNETTDIALENVAFNLGTTLEATKEKGVVSRIWTAIKEMLEKAKKFILKIIENIANYETAESRRVTADVRKALMKRVITDKSTREYEEVAKEIDKVKKEGDRVLKNFKKESSELTKRFNSYLGSVKKNIKGVAKESHNPLETNPLLISIEGVSIPLEKVASQGADKTKKEYLAILKSASNAMTTDIKQHEDRLGKIMNLNNSLSSDEASPDIVRSMNKEIQELIARSTNLNSKLLKLNITILKGERQLYEAKMKIFN